jgi:hypothetical protein
MKRSFGQSQVSPTFLAKSSPYSHLTWHHGGAFLGSLTYRVHHRSDYVETPGIVSYVHRRTNRGISPI